MRALLAALLVLCSAGLLHATLWTPRIPAQVITVPPYAISDANAPVPAKLPFDKARKSLNDSQIWELSVSRCNAHGLFVHNSAEPWCDCHAGYKGTTCAFEDTRVLKNGIVFLVYGSPQYLEEIIATLRTMETNWLPSNPGIDILIFCGPGTLSDDLRRRTEAATSYHVRWFDLWVDYPNNDEVRAAWKGDRRPNNMPCGYVPNSVGYMHMNRFFSVLMFSHPIFYDYDYLMRLDSHLATVKPINCDLFRTVAAANVVFAYLRPGIDNEGCMHGAREVAFEYALKQDFAPNHLRDCYAPNATAFSGTFTWFKTSFWRHPELQRFFHVFDQSGWIYKSRTTDQVMTRMTTALFVPAYAVAQLCDFDPEAFVHNGVPFPFTCSSDLRCIV